MDALWYQNIQQMVEGVDECILAGRDEALTLDALASRLGYSPFYASRMFKKVSGMPLRDYLRLRRLAFALIDLRDSDKSILDIAVENGFSSHEAFTRAFKAAYGLSPSTYRRRPVPLVLRTPVYAFDRYLFGIGEVGMAQSNQEVKIYFVSVPAHQFLHVKNYESDGYFDFWEKQDAIPGQDCDTICGLLDSMKGKLDGDDGVVGRFSGQVMARLYEADGRSPEAYGIRLPATYTGPLPEQMLTAKVAAAAYLVVEHGPFNYAKQAAGVEEQLTQAEKNFNLAATGYALDESPGRVMYLYHDPLQYQKRVRPVVQKE